MENKISEYIECNYEDLRNICKKITCNNELSDDLLHEVILQLLEKNKCDIKQEEIKWYIIRVIQLNWNSKTSPFFYKHKRYIDLKTELTFSNDIEEDNSYIYENEELLQKVENEFCKLSWFYKQLFEQYLVLGSLRKLNLATKIPIASLSRYIRESKQIIKNNIKN